jgi:hypothetical protein
MRHRLCERLLRVVMESTSGADGCGFLRTVSLQGREPAGALVSYAFGHEPALALPICYQFAQFSTLA